MTPEPRNSRVKELHADHMALVMRFFKAYERRGKCAVSPHLLSGLFAHAPFNTRTSVAGEAEL